MLHISNGTSAEHTVSISSGVSAFIINLSSYIK